MRWRISSAAALIRIGAFLTRRNRCRYLDRRRRGCGGWDRSRGNRPSIRSAGSNAVEPHAICLELDTTRAGGRERAASEWKLLGVVAQVDGRRRRAVVLLDEIGADATRDK